MKKNVRRFVIVLGILFCLTVDLFAAENPEWIDSMNLYEINAYSWSWDEPLFDKVEDHFGYLKNLGVNTIWFTPIFEGGGMGYHTTNYYELAERMGTKEQFAEFIKAAHDNGFRVVLDLVISHVSREHPFFQSCLDLKGASPYANYFIWDGEPGASDYDYYYDWDYIPNLNVVDADVKEYLINVAEYWVQEFDIDGYRADIAWGIEQRSNTFWVDCINRLKAIKPDIFMLAEAPAFPVLGSYDGNPSPNHDKSILFDHLFHSAYDWRLRTWDEGKGLPGVLNGERSLNELNSILMEEYPENALPLRFIENHDHERAMALYGKERSFLTHTLVFTVPGIPLLYTAGEVGQTEQFQALIDDANNMLPYFKNLLKIRKSFIKNSAELVRLENSADGDVYSYATISDDGKIVVSVLNFGETSVECTVDASPLPQSAPFALSGLLTDETINVESGQANTIAVSLDGYQAKVYYLNDGSYAPVTSDFTADVTKGSAPMSVQFTDLSTGNISSWSWDFGDGQTSTEQNPVHVYENVGVYTVTLTVSGDDGYDLHAKQDYINVSDDDPANILTNGTFRLEMEGWYTFVNSNANATGQVTNGVFEMSITSAGDADWNVQLIQAGLLIEKGKTYAVSFDIWAASNRTANAQVSEDGGSYTGYSYQHLNLTN